mmetsp:Transcript_50965/g.128603  ORF Transcript_50965/g.128603 Transcript_50965/m.128603 type:complete len:233 (-) Transcript_50965:46-744(-)
MAGVAVRAVVRGPGVRPVGAHGRPVVRRRDPQIELLVDLAVVQRDPAPQPAVVVCAVGTVVHDNGVTLRVRQALLLAFCQGPVPLQRVFPDDVVGSISQVAIRRRIRRPLWPILALTRLALPGAPRTALGSLEVGPIEKPHVERGIGHTIIQLDLRAQGAAVCVPSLVFFPHDAFALRIAKARVFALEQDVVTGQGVLTRDVRDRARRAVCLVSRRPPVRPMSSEGLAVSWR